MNVTLLIAQFIKTFSRQLHFALPALTLTVYLLTACMPGETSSPPLENTPTATVSPTQTATVEWFPPTSTPTLVPTQAVTPTPDFRPNLGEVILSDDFSDPNYWTLGHTSSGNIALGVNELTIAIAESEAYDYSIRQEPILGDFYLEITTSPTLCRGEDQYGVLIRMSSPGDFYRFALSCDGRMRLDRIVQGTASSPQPWTTNSAVPPGAPITSRLGVWVLGDEMRFFVNDQYQFTVNDPLLTAGNLGVFARSAGETAVTVNFSDLVIHQINQ
jgi:hypothetical protein